MNRETLNDYRDKDDKILLAQILDKVEMVLLMSVEPGFGGQTFIPESYERIKALRKYLNEKGLRTKLEVDGGVGKKNIREVMDAGADVFVAGSGIFRKNSITENISKFMEAFAEKRESKI